MGSCTVLDVRGAAPARAASAKRGLECVERACVEDVVRREPRAAGHEDAPPQPSERLTRVGVRGDDDLHAAVARGARLDVAQIEAIDLAVDLEGHAVPPRGLDDGVEVEWVRIAAQDLPSAGMAE